MRLARVLDWIYARLAARRPFFADGLGDREALEWGLVPEQELRSRLGQPPPTAEIRWHTCTVAGRIERRVGRFTSPASAWLPAASREAWVELVADGAGSTSVLVHLAATGDHGFSRRRRWFARPLAERGVASLILENPFYGRRRPQGQGGSAVRTVADLAVMARATVEEARTLLLWGRTHLHGRVGVAGVSMGAQMAGMAAAACPFPVAAALCLPSRSPAAVFTAGALSQAVAWQALRADLGDGARSQLHALLSRGDICRLPPPLQAEATIIVAADHDGYVPRSASRDIAAHWPGSELRRLRSGHVASVLFHRTALLAAMRDALARVDPCAGPPTAAPDEGPRPTR